MKDLMVDIETLGTSTNSVITQIGACYFDRSNGDILKEFQVNIQIQDCLNHGLQIDGGALKFWLEQGTARMTWLKEPVALSKALNDFRRFCVGAENAWAHATFDFPILNNAYDAVKQGHPIPYRNLRDIRTLVNLANYNYVKPVGGGDPKDHNALNDCKYQVKYCVECFNNLRRVK